MSDVAEVSTSSPSELLAAGRRNLAVREFTSAVETLAEACELLAKEHGDTADQCAEAYLWYGKALLGLSREESGVLGDGVPGTGNEEEEDNEEQEGENEESDEKTSEAEAEAVKENGEATSSKAEPEAVSSKTEAQSTEQTEAESTTNDEGMSADDNEEPVSGTTTNGADGDDADISMMNAEGDEEVDNLQLAWEMLDLSRSILLRRAQEGGGDASRALLADVHLALGEVALESETYDKAVIDMQSCLDIQKDLYGTDDRRIAETHYQIGLANSLASNFEDAITHFKNAANILGTRIKTLENPGAADDATVKKYATTDPGYSIEGEIKELKELLPEIQEKIQDMMDYKAETIKRMRESLFSNGAGSSSGAGSSNGSAFSKSTMPNGAGSSSSKPAADISHLIKRKRKASNEVESSSPAKRVTTVISKSTAESTKVDTESTKVIEPAKVAELAKVTELTKVTESAKVEKSEAQSVTEVESEADSSAKTVET